MGIRDGLVILMLSAASLSAAGCGTISSYMSPKAPPDSYRSGVYEVKRFKSDAIEIISLFENGMLRVSHAKGPAGAQMYVHTRNGVCSDQYTTGRRGEIIYRCDQETLDAAMAAVEQARSDAPVPLE
jgi:hypothetical protein